MQPEQIRVVEEQIDDAIMAGDIDKVTALTMTIPLAPEVAYSAFEALGADFLRNSGFDLSAAEAKYGPDWLSKKP